MVVEFALWFPVFALMLCAMTELGMIAARHAMLERGLDLAVRQVQLATGRAPQHDDLKDIICEKAAIIPNCHTMVKLEMRPQNLRNYVALPEAADCTDRSEEVRPSRRYVPGQQNELMILRACAKFSPIFPSSALASSLNRDGAGDYALVSTGAYVQEPR